MKTFYDTMFNNIFARFRLGTIFRNHPSSDMLSDILDYIMNYEGEMDIRIDQYYIRVSTKDFEFNGWNENRYYAWLSQGYFKKKDGRKYEWGSEMPSYYMMAEFRSWVREHQREYVNAII